MPRLSTVLEPLLTRDSPVVVQGTIPPQYDETAVDLVKSILNVRGHGINYFPAFSSVEAVFDVSTAAIVSGDISVAAFEVLGAKARTLHPSHSWIVTGRSAAMMVPGNLYALTPSGMGSPLPEITNFSSPEFLVGVDWMHSVVIEAAEETARVSDALAPSMESVAVITADGTRKESTFQLRSPEPLPRNREKLRDLWLAEDAMVETEWGWLIQTRMAHDSLVRELRSDAAWLRS